MDCFTLSGFAMTLEESSGHAFTQCRCKTIPSEYRTLRVHYAYESIGNGELFLILVAEIVEVPSRGQEQNSMKFPLFCTYPVFFGNKKGVELNAFTYLRPSTAHNE
jgi:hypothetical protein